MWMADTKLETMMLVFPQEHNVHLKIFGGYLMRLAHELGFAHAPCGFWPSMMGSRLCGRGGHKVSHAKQSDPIKFNYYL